ncbi:MAG: enoyl-CoA hydratase/isomerase family protein [Chloroflexi bacterium]|nr:enoyl-CoA hydratase/isomerase family protein [Chloroflexota bacterium]MBM3153998.1 enoyl-CoA hydratase/isomerase family protein [Chloroflexota bacterium]MBM3165998.1 enoyl-CoA hydratase/isomerase family protein [Chloroflexota bacterium]MBM4451812.1 enoyl-CoA hydratase/isomerase family protein [Chloroflexota bacterium]
MHANIIKKKETTVKYEGLKLEKSEHIAVLTIDRPHRLNAATLEMGYIALPRILRDIQEDEDIRVLIITGTGKGFCAGADVNELPNFFKITASLARHEKLMALGEFARLLYDLEIPVIAAVNGVAAGAGVSIALLSDIRIASENASFGLVFVARGLIPDCGATYLMPRLLGAGKSFELMYTGDLIDAREAERIGLVNKVVPHDKLMDEAKAWAKRLVQAPPLALAQIKRAIHKGMLNNLEEQLYFETYAQNFLFGTEDFKEGVDSFLEKRQPHWKGR